MDNENNIETTVNNEENIDTQEENNTQLGEENNNTQEEGTIDEENNNNNQEEDGNEEGNVNNEENNNNEENIETTVNNEENIDNTQEEINKDVVEENNNEENISQENNNQENIETQEENNTQLGEENNNTQEDNSNEEKIEITPNVSEDNQENVEDNVEASTEGNEVKESNDDVESDVQPVPSQEVEIKVKDKEEEKEVEINYSEQQVQQEEVIEQKIHKAEIKESEKQVEKEVEINYSEQQVQQEEVIEQNIHKAEIKESEKQDPQNVEINYNEQQVQQEEVIEQKIHKAEIKESEKQVEKEVEINYSEQKVQQEEVIEQKIQEPTVNSQPKTEEIVENTSVTESVNNNELPSVQSSDKEDITEKQEEFLEEGSSGYKTSKISLGNDITIENNNNNDNDNEIGEKDITDSIFYISETKKPLLSDFEFTEEEKKVWEFSREKYPNIEEHILLRVVVGKKFVQENIDTCLPQYLKYLSDTKLDTNWSNIERFLKSNFLYFPSHSKNKNGFFYFGTILKNFNGNNFSRKCFVQSMGIIVEVLMSNPQVLRNGIVVLNDLTDSKWTNFRIPFYKYLYGSVQKVVPIRLKNVYVKNAPRFYRAIYTIVKPFMKQKNRERIVMLNNDTLFDHFEKNELLKEFGGEAKHSNSAIFKVWEKHFRNINNETESNVDNEETINEEIKIEEQEENNNNKQN